MEIFKEIAVGGLSKDQLISQLVEAGVQFNKYADVLFQHPFFSPAEQVTKLKLMKVGLADLGLKIPCSYEQILTMALAMGLKPCPLWAGAFLRLEYLDQPQGPYLTIASPPPEQDEDYPKGFYVRNLDNSLWLRGYRASGECEWPAGNEFLFCE